MCLPASRCAGTGGRQSVSGTICTAALWSHILKRCVSFVEMERETVAVEYAQPKALSSFANLKHLRIYMCRYGSLPKCLTTLTVLHSLEIASPLGPISFPWSTLSRLTSLKLENSLTNEDSAQVNFPESLHTLHINNPGKICLQTLPRLAELVITHGHPDSQTLPYLTGLTQLRFNAQGHMMHLSLMEKTAMFSALVKLKSLVSLEVDGTPSSRRVKGLTSLSKLTSLALLNQDGEEQTLCNLNALRHLLSMVNLQQLTCYFRADGHSYVAETVGQPSGGDIFCAGNLSDDISESDKYLSVAFYLMSPVSSLKLAVREENASD